MAIAETRLAASLAERYRLERELGRGGMATVYLATDLKHGRPVALKVLSPVLATAVGPERFLREIEILARLNHPHILALLDSGTAEAAGPGGAVVRAPYFVMPFVDGESLRDRLQREGPLPPVEAARIAREIADALAYAHAHGVLHRDIKPANVLLSDGHAVVADFGIAGALGLASDRRLTTTGVSLGTPQYMSPEQAAGFPGGLDPRSDLYSLGCVLFEMLAGEPPGPGAGVGPRPTALRIPSRRGAVPEALSRVVSRALAPVAGDRFPTAAAMKAALALADGVPPGRRWPRVAPLVVLAAVSAAALWWRLRPEPPSLDPGLIAVAPFDVPPGDSDLEVWREGMVDFLSRGLDGAGVLRTVSPTTVIRRWSGRADRASGLALGRRTGAGRALVGQLLRVSADSARVTAQLLDTRRDAIVGEYDVRGGLGQIDRLGDSLVLGVLRSAAGGTGREGVRSGRAATPPVAALKAFLAGEQLLRRASWDSALGQFQRAVTLDSSFAFAWYRAGLVLAWQRTDWDSLAGAYRDRAASLNRGLAPRDSLLVWADSLSTEIYRATGPVRGKRLRLMRSLEAGAQRWPDDPEIWRVLGEEGFHHGLSEGYSRGRVLEAFERSIQLDSTYAASYVHPITLAFAVRGPESGARYLDAFLQHAPFGFQADGARLAAEVMQAGPRIGPELLRRLDALSGPGLFEGWAATLWAGDSGMAAVRFATELVTRDGPGPPLLANRSFRLGLAAHALMIRGRLRETARLGGLALSALLELGLAGAVPPAVVDLDLRRRLDGGGGDVALGPIWWAFRGDTASLIALRARCERAPGQEPPCLGRFAAAAADAYLDLASGDTLAAVSKLQALPDSLCPACYLHRHTLRQLLERLGRRDELSDLLGRELVGLREGGGVSEVQWVLARARLAEARGDTVAATRSYGIVVGLWSAADRELGPDVVAAREGLARLGPPSGRDASRRDASP
jgi:serine/threonine-protein kinase